METGSWRIKREIIVSPRRRELRSFDCQPTGKSVPPSTVVAALSKDYDGAALRVTGEPERRSVEPVATVVTLGAGQRTKRDRPASAARGPEEPSRRCRPARSESHSHRPLHGAAGAQAPQEEAISPAQSPRRRLGSTRRRTAEEKHEQTFAIGASYCNRVCPNMGRCSRPTKLAGRVRDGRGAEHAAAPT